MLSFLNNELFFDETQTNDILNEINLTFFADYLSGEAIYGIVDGFSILKNEIFDSITTTIPNSIYKFLL